MGLRTLCGQLLGLAVPGRGYEVGEGVGWGDVPCVASCWGRRCQEGGMKSGRVWGGVTYPVWPVTGVGGARRGV